jgi:hypothetical protein
MMGYDAMKPYLNTQQWQKISKKHYSDIRVGKWKNSCIKRE